MQFEVRGEWKFSGKPAITIFDAATPGEALKLADDHGIAAASVAPVAPPPAPRVIYQAPPKPAQFNPLRVVALLLVVLGLMFIVGVVISGAINSTK